MTAVKKRATLIKKPSMLKRPERIVNSEVNRAFLTLKRRTGELSKLFHAECAKISADAKNIKGVAFALSRNFSTISVIPKKAGPLVGMTL
jgi:hypothetical protein